MATPINEISKLGKCRTLVIPAKLCQRFGLKEGSLVIAEATAEGILLRPAIAVRTVALAQEEVETLLVEGIASGASAAMTQEDWNDMRQVIQTIQQP